MSVRFKFIFLLGILFFSNICLAERVLASGQLDLIVEQFRMAATRWSAPLKDIAYQIFYALAVIEVSWTGMQLLLKQADIQEIVGEAVRRFLYMGFFLAVMDYSAIWSSSTIEFFRNSADKANIAAGGSQGISPSSIFDIGLFLGNKVANDISIVHPGDSIALVLSSMLIFLCFTLIAALLLEALIEMYIILNAGVLFLGFGGSSLTQEYATKYIQYGISVGAKIFAMQLLIGVGESLIRGWSQTFNSDTNADVLILIGCSVVMLQLVRSIPSKIQSIFSSVNFGGGSDIVQTASQIASIAAGAAMAGAGTTAGAAFAGHAALQNATAQGATTTASKLTGAAKTLAKSSASDLAGRFAGTPGSRYGSMAGRIASNLQQQTAELNAQKSMDKHSSEQNQNAETQSPSSSSSSQTVQDPKMDFSPIDSKSLETSATNSTEPNLSLPNPKLKDIPGPKYDK